MKKLKHSLVMALLLMLSFFSFSQKTISDGILVYDIVMHTNSKEPKMADALDGGTITVYLKGSQSRLDMVTALGKESTLHDTKTGETVILKEYSSQKLMITLTKENWDKKNKAYNNIEFKITNDTTTIAGYFCKKAIATLPNGKNFAVFYTPDLLIANKEYNTLFKNLPGIAMQYQYGLSVITLSKINFEPVPAFTFDIPKSGYRTMTYEENKEMIK